MNAPQPLVLIGGGGHAAVVADAALAAGWNLAGYFDDQPQPALGLPHLGSVAAWQSEPGNLSSEAKVHAAVGDAALRRQWLAAMDDEQLATIVHPSAVISPSAVVGRGVFIGPLAVVNARAVIGRGAIINSGAVVEHDCSVGEFCHVAPRAVLTGSVCLGDATLVGCGAVVLPGVSIGRGATVGAGAVVTADLPRDVVAAGVPARAGAAR